jgi:uridylate kinase
MVKYQVVGSKDKSSGEMPKYQRVLLKISGEALLGGRAAGIDPVATLSIAREIARVVKDKTEVAIVLGAGNLFRGQKAALNGMDRATADYIGMVATVMNALALQDALEKIKVASRVMTAFEMKAVAEPYIRLRALRHLARKRVVVLAAGTGHPYFSTDSAAALRALELHAEVLLKGTKVDGVYDKDPVKHRQAKKFNRLTIQDALEKNYQVMDAPALALCRDNSLPIRVFNLFKKKSILKVVRGESIGTLVK